MRSLALFDAGSYVAAAYLVFLALVVIYVVIIASKLTRTESRLRDLSGRVSKDDHG
jgi:hypothetical protein